MCITLDKSHKIWYNKVKSWGLLSFLKYFFSAMFSLTVSDGSFFGMGGHDSSSAANNLTITTAWQLVQVASLVNNGIDSFSGKTITLGNDIDLSKRVTWTPIGNPARPFNGVFDGNGRVLSHLTINAPDSDDVGLFGVVGTSGVVKNVKLTNADITGGDVAGGAAGVNFGVLSGCEVSGYFRGGNNVGGITGWNDGRVERCRASGRVEGVRGSGGLVGANSGQVRNCVAFVSVRGRESVGVLIGFNNGSVTDNRARGSVTVNDVPTRCSAFVGECTHPDCVSGNTLAALEN
jgi:hypothetical protein